jgi:tetratricopeptide (TPR) repeat protein
LDQAAAVQLLDNVVRTGRPDDDRISGDPAAAGRLAKSCGGLPLALQITAALLVADPMLTAAELAAELADEVRRLETLRYEDGSGVSAPSVAAAFELSYRQLDQDAARLFRLLPAAPGPDVFTQGAAELADWPAGRARAVIGRLARAHLIEPGGARGRWRMHDLLSLYARQVPEVVPGEREEAFGRLLAWYLRYARAADAHLRALAGMALPAEFTGRDDALGWLDAERPGLIAAVAMAAAVGRPKEAMLLPLNLGEYLNWRRRFDDWLAVLAVSRDSAHQLNNKRNEAAALTDLGIALREVRRFDEAIAACQDAAVIYREAGDWHGVGMALNNLGTALTEVRRFDEAINAQQAAAGICRETGDWHGEGMALNNLGLALMEVRRFEEAISAQQAAAGICRKAGDRVSEGRALTGLGGALRKVRRFDEAIGAQQAAAGIFREAGDRYGEGIALTGLGAIYHEMQQPGRAAACWREAAAGMRDAGDNEEAARLEKLAAKAQF